MKNYLVVPVLFLLVIPLPVCGEPRSPVSEWSLISAPGAWESASPEKLSDHDAFQVDMNWKNDKLTSAAICSNLGGPCRIRLPQATQFFVNNGAVKTNRLARGIFAFPITAGQTYHLTPKR